MQITLNIKNTSAGLGRDKFDEEEDGRRCGERDKVQSLSPGLVAKDVAKDFTNMQITLLIALTPISTLPPASNIHTYSTPSYNQNLTSCSTVHSLSPP
jgi:hypothetical protein